MTNWTFKYLRRTAYTKNQFEDYISKTEFPRHDIREAEDSIGFEIWLEKNSGDELSVADCKDPGLVETT